MKFVRSVLLTSLVFFATVVSAQKGKTYQLTSPGGVVTISVVAGDKLTWAVAHKGDPMLTASPLSMQLTSGEVLGDKATVTSAKTDKVMNTIQAINYKKKVIQDHYN